MIGQQQIRRFPFLHEAVLTMLLIGLLGAAGFMSPTFMKMNTQIELSTHIWELALIAIPMTLIIITAGIDLSVGSTIALCAVALGLMYERGFSPWTGALVAIATGVAAGALNGIFVSYVRVHPLIVTLATLAAYRGIAEGISLGRPISRFPDSFALIGRGTIGGLPIPGIIWFIVMLLAALVMARTPAGRHIHAIGYNETGARFSGIAVNRIKLLLYTLSGTAAAVAAIMFVARRNTAKADIGNGMELEVITAVVLGGTSIYGGKGRIAGTVLGVLLIHETREFISWYFQNNELIFVVIGALLILSVLLHRMLGARPS
jgi:rhamnose transport system permease protein